MVSQLTSQREDALEAHERFRGNTWKDWRSNFAPVHSAIGSSQAGLGQAVPDQTHGLAMEFFIALLRKIGGVGDCQTE